MLRLHDDLTPPKDGLDWRDFVEWVDGLSKWYMDTASLPRLEGDNLELLEASIRELESLDDVENGATLDGFVWRSARRSVGPPRERARLGRGFSPGPSETRSDSGSIRSTSWAWSRASCPRESETTPCCPTKNGSRQGSRSGAALLPNGTSTWPRHPPGAPPCSRSPAATTPLRGSSTRPRWFLEEASRLNGSPVYPSMLSSPAELASLREQPWFEMVASAQESINSFSGSQPADVHDYDLHHLWRWRRSGKPIGQHHIVTTENVLARALRMERARNARMLTVWDGDLSAASFSSGRIGLSNRDLFSPTRLETWATCPYRYFLSNVLGIAAPEQPEEIATISPLDRGSLIHTVLERFVQAAQKQGTTPQPDQPWTEDHRRLLMGIAEEEFRDAEQRGVTGKPLLWEIAQAEISRRPS